MAEQYSTVLTLFSRYIRSNKSTSAKPMKYSATPDDDTIIPASATDHEEDGRIFGFTPRQWLIAAIILVAALAIAAYLIISMIRGVMLTHPYGM